MTLLLQEGSDELYCFSCSIERMLKKQTRYMEDGEIKYHPPGWYDKIIIAYNIRCAHWLCVCVFPGNNTIEAYCSFGLKYRYELKCLYRLMYDWYHADWLPSDAKLKYNYKWKLYHGRQSITRQGNGYDCGLHCIQFQYLLSVNGKLSDITVQQTDIQ